MKKSLRLKQKNRSVKKSSSKKRPALRVLKFLPAIAILGLSASIHTAPSFATNTTPSTVLSYATSVSVGDLLSQTNSQRTANGVSALSLNSALNSAAQAKANDMVARDYWSHVTPDGQQPWVFITQAGYSYTLAGENLAYGFGTSADTIAGWMNSQPHKENLLKSTFLDAGFGIANSSNYVGTGQQTIVVAMYGKSAESAAPAPVTTPPASKPATKASTAAKPAPSTTPQAIETIPAPTPAAVEEAKPEEAAPQNIPVAATASPVEVSRVQLLTGGNAAWSATLLSIGLFSMGMLWFINRGLQIKRMVLAGERFVLHHAHLDLTVLSILVLGWTLLGTGGIIR